MIYFLLRLKDDKVSFTWIKLVHCSKAKQGYQWIDSLFNLIMYQNHYQGQLAKYHLDI